MGPLPSREELAKLYPMTLHSKWNYDYGRDEPCLCSDCNAARLEKWRKDGAP